MNESDDKLPVRWWLWQQWNEDHGMLDPRLMPANFFPRVLRLDYDSALPADVLKQTFTVVPRYWYIDAAMRCERCGLDFRFSAQEQKVWYEDYRRWIDAFPKLCTPCRRFCRDRKALRQLYDRDIAAAMRSEDCDWKSYLLAIIDRMNDVEVELPTQVQENRKILAGQIGRRRKQDESQKK